MPERSARLERLVADESNAASDEAVAERLAALDDLATIDEDTLAVDLQTLDALANESRYRILRLLERADRELTVSEIVPTVAIGDSAVSHALAALREAGLVERRTDGTWRRYRETDRAERLLDALAATRERGDGGERPGDPGRSGDDGGGE